MNVSDRKEKKQNINPVHQTFVKLEKKKRNGEHE